MVIVFYNTISRKKEKFDVKGEINIYTCGPTVYDYAHIGNFRAFLFYDLIHRYLEWHGFKVKHVMNITDVDDKTIKRSRESGISLKEYTRFYEKVFFKDMETLAIKKFDFYPRATEHIKDMVKIINGLLKKGYAYISKDGSIYYNISKFKEYGKLSKISIKNLKVGMRVSQDEYEKQHIYDFALWKAYNKEDGDVFWDEEFFIEGKKRIIRGRPGWHIECSAMSMKYLGETLDIHCGGVDLIFPHHENEIAQSEAYTGKTFVKFWLHNEHVLINGEKMSKKLGNYYTLRDLIKMGYKPMAIRLLLLSAHYRSKLNITDDALKHAETNLNKILSFVEGLRYAKHGTLRDSIKKVVDIYRQRFKDAIDDDLNTPLSLSIFFEFISKINKELDEGKLTNGDANYCMLMIRDFNSIFGVLDRREREKFVKKAVKEIKDMGIEVKFLGVEKTLDIIMEIRSKLRKEKKYNMADKIREILNKNNILVEDIKEESRWKVLA